jgi:hypothetical protein
MLRTVRNQLLRRGLETAVSLTADAAANATAKSFNQVFVVSTQTALYVRGSMIDVIVRRVPEPTDVELQANLHASFGWEFKAEQDEQGIYIVALRKPIVGALARATFTLIAPANMNLICKLTPGTLHLDNVDGTLRIAGNSR